MPSVVSLSNHERESQPGLRRAPPFDKLMANGAAKGEC